ncbi:MAG: type IX secretion system sortase PorU [Tannerella sp.]|nr:type IX secretion system sortase PorU [Tannerella sp.]
MLIMRLILSILGMCMLSSMVWADGSQYAAQSVLSEGKWVKIRVDKTGIYKLTYSDLKKMGFSEPEKVSVHGYGGWILDEDFSKPYIDDVPAVSVWRGSDYILFYAKGPVKWTYGTNIYGYDRQITEFFHENNPYSMYGYYFVTDATPSNEMDIMPSVNGASLQINTFDDFFLYEKELESINASGRELFGESFEMTGRTFSFQIPGITNDDARISMRFVAKATTTPGTVTLYVNDRQMIQENIAVNTNIYTKGLVSLSTAVWSGEKNESPKVSISFTPFGYKSWLDYVRLQVKRQLQAYGEPFMFFRNVSSQKNVSRFTIQNATSNMLVFDVTDGINPSLVETTLNGSELFFTIPADDVLHEFALVDLAGSIPSPETVGEVAHQNLHALPQTDMVILSPPAFIAESERLAEKHRTNTGISVTIVTPEQIYNEFSSGTPDATAIRRFMKMFYDRRTSNADAPKYLLLFGDGSYDNRQLTDTWKNVSLDNFLLTYQTANSVNEDSYVMDDYFGFLADNEGLSHSTDQLLLGIGRFPARTTGQANDIVNKVIAYMENKDVGTWKNQFCFVADDGSNSDGYKTIHMSQSYQLTQVIENNYPSYLSDKLFFDAFKKSNEGGFASYPDVETAIVKDLKEGVFLINYTGHGNHESWSDERVITDTYIRQTTYSHLPLWITATCDFAPFDAFVTSAGENVLLNAKSGGIALFTTTRVAYDVSNFNINKLLIENLLKTDNGRHLTLGDVIRETKQTFKDRDRVRFVLLGDPAMTLAFPEHRMEITEINGQDASSDTLTFRALDKITIKGHILAPDGQPATAFHGMAYATIMDSEQTITTLDNNNTGITFEYKDYPNVLYKGNSAVTDGEFSLSFTVPKDISYSNLPGKISMYAYDETNRAEAQGCYKRFKIGGTATQPEDDTEGPEIRALYLNDSTFADGGKVNETPFLIAVLWDKSGVNISGSSIGHDITLVIDNNPQLSYNLNSYYELLSEGEGMGIIRFPIPALAAGSHTAELKVWDVLNNSSTQVFGFEVVEGLKPFITELTAAPVPARDQVTFMLSHNRPESQMTVNIRVYDMTGRLRWEHEENGSSSVFSAYTVTWNLTDGSGRRLPTGVYLYRAAIRTGATSEATKAKKLIILAQ